MRSAVVGGCAARPWHATHLRSVRVHRRALLLISLLVVATALNLLVFAAYVFILLGQRRPTGLSAVRGEDAAARDDGQQHARTSCSSCAAFCAAAAGFGLRPIAAAELPSCAWRLCKHAACKRAGRRAGVGCHVTSARARRGPGEQASPYCGMARPVVPA